MSSTTTISYYVPNNAVIAASGDFLSRRIEEAFGGMRQARASPVTAIEPPSGPRAASRCSDPPPDRRRSHGVPVARRAAPDTAALLIADAILSGAKPSGAGRRRDLGRPARLYKALVALASPARPAPIST